MESTRNAHTSHSVQYTNGGDMDLFEANTHPFVIKIWLEETAEEAGRAMWRGHITHVPTGERRYLKGLDDITKFVAPYLAGMGVRLDPSWRVRRWLRRWKHGPAARG